MQDIADATAVELIVPLLRDTNSVIRSRAFDVVRAITGQTISEHDPAKWEAWWAANKTPSLRAVLPLRCVCQRLGAYDRLVAAVAGALKDDLGKVTAGVQAGIFDDARYERLEAEGRTVFAVKIEEMQKLFRKTGTRTARKNEHENAQLDSGIVLLATGCQLVQSHRTVGPPELVSVSKIWSESPHKRLHRPRAV